MFFTSGISVLYKKKGDIKTETVVKINISIKITYKIK